MMKRTLQWFGQWLGLIAGTILFALAPAAFGQESAQPPHLAGYYKHLPLRGARSEQVMGAIESGAAIRTVPMWNYTITSPVDGNTYSGAMVGGSPYFNGLRNTKIPVVLVPLIIKMPDGSNFDPTAADPCGSTTPIAAVQGSPVLQPTAYSMNGVNVGTGQYLDAFQRASFFATNVSTTGDSYHTTLAPVTTLAAQTITIPANEGASYSLGGCGKLGVMDFGTFDNIIVNTVMPGLASQGVTPSTFPMFILHNVVMGDPGDSASQNCCVIGYHGAVGFPPQTYSPVDYDTTGLFRGSTDVAAMSHEVGEWMDDPLGSNPTPSWGHTGQVTGCQNNLEVGDPLSGTLFPAIKMANGLTYHPQELAMFSWFFRQNPSIGAGGKYSDNGTFSTGAGAVCQ
jgi:hypothetical protein